MSGARLPGPLPEIMDRPLFDKGLSLVHVLLDLAGADTGFRKQGGGGPDKCLLLKSGEFGLTCATFFPLFMKFPQISGGGKKKSTRDII